MLHGVTISSFVIVSISSFSSHQQQHMMLTPGTNSDFDVGESCSVALSSIGVNINTYSSSVRAVCA